MKYFVSITFGIILLGGLVIVFDPVTTKQEANFEVRSDAGYSAVTPVVSDRDRSIQPVVPNSDKGLNKTAISPSQSAFKSELNRKSREERREKVEESLRKFRERTDHYTVDDIRDERQHLQETIVNLQAVEVDEPRVTTFVDSLDQPWKKLEYSSGEVRYELPEEDKDELE